MAKHNCRTHRLTLYFLTLIIVVYIFMQIIGNPVILHCKRLHFGQNTRYVPYHNVSRSLIGCKETFSHRFPLEGRVFRKKYFHTVRGEVSFSFVHSFTDDVRLSASKMIPFEMNETGKIFVTAPAFAGFKDRFYAVIRVWLLQESSLKDIHKKQRLNKFQNNFLFAQSFDRYLKPLEIGRFLGIPTPLETNGDPRTGPVDPRIVAVGDRLLLIFFMRSRTSNYPVALNTYVFDLSTNQLIKPKVEGKDQTQSEKNWAPFDKGGVLHFVYTFDPLWILKCEDLLNCKFVYKEKSNRTRQFEDGTDKLRGGTQFEKYSGQYYISVAHSKRPSCSYAHVVLMRVDQWRIVYVSDIINMSPQFERTVKYVVPWMKEPFLFPVGLNIESDDTIDIATNIADTQSHIMRLSGMKRILDETVRFDRPRQSWERPRQGMIQRYIQECHEKH